MTCRLNNHLRRIFLILLISLLLMAEPACFRVVEPKSPDRASSESKPIPTVTVTVPAPANATPGLTLPPSPAQWSGSPYRFLWMMEGANAGERFGASVGLLGDVDGDGTPDIVVGAPLASPSGKNNAGSVYVISLRNVRALYRLDGQHAGDQFGQTLAVIGDVDGDGIADFIVGAPLGDVQSFPDAGYAMIYSGKDGKMLDYYTGVGTGFRLGHSVAGLADLNRDGFPDFAVGTPSASRDGKDNCGAIIIEVSKNHPLNRAPIIVSGEAAGDNFGWSIASIGDINHDSVPDIAVGATGVKTPSGATIGRVYALSGLDGSILYKIDGRQTGNQFGFSIVGIDDINGDNVPDLIVGAPQPTGSAESNGKAYVFSGRDGSLLYELTSTPSGSLFGFSVSSGDYDGDGRSDIIVSDPGTYGNHGSVHVFSGRDGKRYFIFTNNPNRKEEIGSALGPARDMNGDGRAELLIGAPGAPSIEGKPTGRVYVLIKSDQGR